MSPYSGLNKLRLQCLNLCYEDKIKAPSSRLINYIVNFNKLEKASTEMDLGKEPLDPSSGSLEKDQATEKQEAFSLKDRGRKLAT